jgi:tetratricopeptide (TPR) repeat protein
MRKHLLRAVVASLAMTACAEPGQTEQARGNVLASQHKLAQAAEAYRKAAQAVPGKARPRELLGHVLFDLQKWPEARAAYEEALKAEPAQALEAEVGLARLDTEQGKVPEAFERLTRVLEKAPENLYARLSRANLAMRRAGEQDARLALDDTAAALQVDPANAAVLYTRGCAFIAARDLVQAKQTFDLLALGSPKSPLAPYGMARAAGAANDRTEVIHNLREARARAKSSPGAWKPDEVRQDPAFRFMRDDAEFVKELAEP